MKDLHIVIVNYFYKSDVLRLLDSIKKDLQACPYQVQITVVDNSKNQDGIQQALATLFPQVVYIDAKGNKGFGQATTIGFVSTEAKYYFALNPDTLLLEQSNTITRIIDMMEAHPNIGCIGPKLLNTDGTLQQSCYHFDRPSILIKPLRHAGLDKKYGWAKRHVDKLEMRAFDHQETRPVDWVLGAAMVVRKEVIDTIGWFDNRFHMYLEDADWCFRMWEAGFPVYYIHDIVIKHSHARESSKVPGIFRALFFNRLARIHFYSWIKFLWKWRKQHKYYEYLP